MSMNNSLKHLQRQEQKVSTSMIQGLNMLSLPTFAMYDYLVELSVSNPMLEIPEQPFQEIYESVEQDRLLELYSYDKGKEPEYYDGDYSENTYSNEEYNPYYSAGENFCADSLSGSLELQLSMCRFSPLEEAIGRDILGNLDENGYFIGDLNTICLLYCCRTDVGEAVLRTIQGFSPKGIAARNVYEALCLQVDDSFPYADLARVVIKNDLQAMSQNLCAECAARYKVNPECMRQIFDYIKSLEPRPGNCDEQKFKVGYIRPDIVVRKTGDELAVYVLGDNTNPLRLNNEYLDLMKQPGLAPEDKLYLRSCLNSAKALIYSVDVRRQTLHKAALSLATLQGDFFRYGPDYLRPLSMQQMADSMGVNVSTVSRVAQDKYVCSTWGTFPLKHFFVRTAKGADDSLMSVATAKQKIEHLISCEDPAHPITDEQISIRLKEEGYCISRRTVSKYRQEAGILGCVQRKQRRIV